MILHGSASRNSVYCFVNADRQSNRLQRCNLVELVLHRPSDVSITCRTRALDACMQARLPHAKYA
jgi:hypothetical protein